MTTLWRLHLRSGKSGVDHTAQVAHCAERNIGAVGWALDPPPPATLDESQRRTLERWGAGPANTVRRLGGDARVGDLVWTRDTDGSYLLGSVDGPWHYDDSGEAAAVDCPNTRPIRWAPRRLLDAEVPGDVIRSFSGRGSSFQRVKARAVVLSQLSYDELCGRPSEAPLPTRHEILHAHLAPFDVEDLVYVYLQAERDYLVLPASRRTDSLAYEYVMVHRPTGRLAIAQVKTGNVSLNVGDLARAARETDADAFAFSTDGRYHGADDGAVQRITDKALLDFAAHQPHLLPPRVRRWFATSS